MNGITIATVVEGHGEVQAVPVLIRRLAAAADKPQTVVPTPFRLPRSKFHKEGELERAVAVASRRVTSGGGVLVLLDADDDCPVTLAADLRQRAVAAVGNVAVGVVVADREFEAWFLAALPSLREHPDVLPIGPAVPDAEGVRDAKGALAEHLVDGRYTVTRHQPAFAQVADLSLAERARSFRKLQVEINRLLGS